MKVKVAFKGKIAVTWSHKSFKHREYPKGQRGRTRTLSLAEKREANIVPGRLVRLTLHPYSKNGRNEFTGMINCHCFNVLENLMWLDTKMMKLN